MGLSRAANGGCGPSEWGTSTSHQPISRSVLPPLPLRRRNPALGRGMSPRPTTSETATSFHGRPPTHSCASPPLTTTVAIASGRDACLERGRCGDARWPVRDRDDVRSDTERDCRFRDSRYRAADTFPNRNPPNERRHVGASRLQRRRTLATTTYLSSLVRRDRCRPSPVRGGSRRRDCPVGDR